MAMTNEWLELYVWHFLWSSIINMPSVSVWNIIQIGLKDSLFETFFLVLMGMFMFKPASQYIERYQRVVTCALNWRISSRRTFINPLFTNAAICSRWFLAREFLYHEDEGDMFLWNVGSRKIYTAPYTRRQQSS
jgi:hypothetical protein